jgi:hypothetical protein
MGVSMLATGGKAGRPECFTARGTRGQTGLPANFRQKAPEIHGSLVGPRRNKSGSTFV